MTTRLEAIRAAIRAENVSYAELAELQGMADQIDPGDVELLQWAGVPEFPEDAGDVSLVNFQVTASQAFGAAGALWSGDTLPDWRENEYLRGQVETLADLFGSPFESERDWEDVKDWYASQIGGNA